TQMNDQNFEFYLPEGAQVDQAMAKTAGGQPVNSSAVPQKEKNRYAFIFPLRPGETQFQISYHLPYNGQATLDPKSLYPLDHFVVMLLKSMQFSGPASFQSMQDLQQSDSLVQVVFNAQRSRDAGWSANQRSRFAPRRGPRSSHRSARSAREIPLIHIERIRLRSRDRWLLHS